MAAKINHVAILSGNYALEAKFYEAMFGLRTSPKSRPVSAVSIGDGYVGMNINPRRAGRPARLDHFGIQVDDLAGTMARMQAAYPQVEALKRPSTRPFAAWTTHDPDGNVFDLTEARGDNLKDVYTHNDWQQPRAISHLGLRTLHPEACARFYMDMFGLSPANLPIADAHGVTDGRITLIILPWRISDYAGTGIVGPGMDYIGFRVDDLEQFQTDVRTIADNNPLLAPFPVDTGPEGKARHAMFARTSLGTLKMADPDGVLLDIVG